VSTVYVIGAYVGDRGHMEPAYLANHWTYLKEQLSMLTRLRHRLAHVVIEISSDVEFDPLFIGAFIGRSADVGCPVEVHRRPNVGQSYGGFANAFTRYGDRFSHYLFNEDDYVFTQDYFDEAILDEFESMPNCGLMGGAAYCAGKDPLKHMAVQPNFSSTEILAKAAAGRGGELPYDHESASYRAGWWGQKHLSFSVAEQGYEICDWLEHWASGYRSGTADPMMVRWFSRSEPGGQSYDPQFVRGQLDKTALIVPVQALDIESYISDGMQWWLGRVGRDGKLRSVRTAGVPGTWPGS
jgi:hypothetical protein